VVWAVGSIEWKIEAFFGDINFHHGALIEGEL
jgi:hypothetical protein